MTTARTPSSADTCAAAAASSSTTWALSAFIGGRSSRMVATPASVCTWTNSVTTAPPALAAEKESLSPQVAVGHADRRLGHGDQAELGPAGQQRVAGQHP